MLNSAADYKCVDVTRLSGFISGNPMPKRDNKGDGSWRAMKYEDLLFLQEAKAERINWKEEPSSKSNPKGRIFSRSSFIDACVSSTDCVDFVPFDQSYDPIDVQNADYSNGTFHVILNRSSFEDVFGSLELEEFQVSEKKASADDVRKAYFNLKNLKRTVYKFDPEYNQLSNFVLDNSIKFHWFDTRDGTPDYTTPPQAGNYIYNSKFYQNAHVQEGFFLYAAGGMAVIETVHKLRSYTTTSSFQNLAQLAIHPYAEKANLLFFVEISSYAPQYNLNNPPNVRYTDAVVFPCDINENYILIPQINITNVINTILTLHGISRIDTYVPTINDNDCVYVYARYFSLVEDNAFPAEIDSLNWNWTPSSQTQS